ncbi:hypothetical protein L6Q79_11430 [bacterium]|nr:hypothetical protein [bacterium]NUN46902.1 hypothetical protein [bacterium]
MKHLMTGACILVLVALTSCGGDDAAKPEEFGTQEEALTALNANKSNMLLALDAAEGAIDAASGFGLDKRSAYNSKKLNRAMTYTYDASTGWWTDEYTNSSGGYNYDYTWNIRFTPRDANGYSTDETSKMEYKYDYLYNGANTYYSYDMDLGADMTLTGVNAYRAATGNLVLNGTNAISYVWDYSYLTYDYTYDYSHKYTYKSLEISPDGDYPEGGSVSFTIRSKFEGEIGEEGGDALNYYVAGKITFDGDNTALLEFGGFSFILNLDTNEVTPA